MMDAPRDRYRLHLAALGLAVVVTGAAACEDTQPTRGAGGAGAEATTTTSGGGAGGAGGQGGSPSGSGAGPSILDCPALCTIVDDACTGGDSQYGPSVDDDEFCELLCPRWEEGTLGDVSGPTQACRSHYTQLAEVDPGANCSAAGPFGGTVCGTQCEAFCLAVVRFCDEPGLVVYANEQDCMADCVSFAGQDQPYAWVIGDTTDSFGCRANAALDATLDPTNFCPRTGGPSALIPNAHCVD